MPYRSHPLPAFPRPRRIAPIASDRPASVFASPLRFRFGLRQRSSSTSRLIGEPLADHALQQAFGALGIVHAKRDAVVVAEIKLRQIAVQMIVAAMLIDALHAALEHGEEAFDGVGMHAAIGARDVLTFAVTGELVIREVIAQTPILTCLIGQHSRFRMDVCLQDREQGRSLEIVHDHAAGLAAVAIYQCQNLVLVFVAAPLLHPFWLLLPVVADEGFVHFDEAAAKAEHRATGAHGFAHAMAHEPRGFQGDAQGAVKLIRANALLAGRDEEDRLQPQAQRDMAGLKDGADLDGKRFPAVVALVGADPGAFAGQLAYALGRAAMHAKRAVRPDARFNEGVCGFFVVEVRGGKDGSGHDSSPMAEILPLPFGYVKYNIAFALRHAICVLANSQFTTFQNASMYFGRAFR